MYYLDTSAAVKLVVAEEESTSLQTWITPREDQVFSSDLLRTELLRAARRVAPRSMVQARLLLDSLHLLRLDSKTFERAGLLAPNTLRSLDAIHLASAMEVGDDLQGIICYDRRLNAAAAQLGITAVAPSS